MLAADSSRHCRQPQSRKPRAVEQRDWPRGRLHDHKHSDTPQRRGRRTVRRSLNGVLACFTSSIVVHGAGFELLGQVSSE
jgi:hypothetical protein